MKTRRTRPHEGAYRIRKEGPSSTAFLDCDPPVLKERRKPFEDTFSVSYCLWSSISPWWLDHSLCLNCRCFKSDFNRSFLSRIEFWLLCPSGFSSLPDRFCAFHLCLSRRDCQNNGVSHSGANKLYVLKEHWSPFLASLPFPLYLVHVELLYMFNQIIPTQRAPSEVQIFVEPTAFARSGRGARPYGKVIYWPAGKYHFQFRGV